MSLLDQLESRRLLEDAEMTGRDVRSCKEHLTDFVARYLPLFHREELRQHLRLAVQGRLSGLERKTSEPIAREAAVHRRGLQRFVGAGNWDNEAVMTELRRHVVEEFADDDGVLVLDPSGFPKKGKESCGVKRQWCGRLGKTDNCQVGVFLTYATSQGHVPLDRRLFLPKDWSGDTKRRKKCHVPSNVRFRTKWQIGLKMIDTSRDVPHAWVTGDDEFGRVSTFRARLRKRRERYVLDVPCNTLVRDLDETVAHRGRGRPRKPPFRRVDEWTARQPESAWQEMTIRAGEKGPLRVKVLRGRVQTRTQARIGPEECVAVIRTLESSPRTYYTLSNAKAEVATEEIVRAHAQRHRVEEMLQEGKGEVGLDHYEVRSWPGWHHHMTLCSLALLFLALEKRRLGEKNPGGNRAASPRRVQRVAA